jgi:hypothetical protein
LARPRSATSTSTSQMIGSIPCNTKLWTWANTERPSQKTPRMIDPVKLLTGHGP